MQGELATKLAEGCKMNEKYTKEGLPIVSKDRLDSLMGEMLKEVMQGIRCRGPDAERDITADLLKQIGEENPHASKYIAACMGATFINPCQSKAIQGMIMGQYLANFYRLLKSQAEANKLEEQVQERK